MLAGLLTGWARLTNRNIFYHRLSAFPLSRQDHREHFVQFLSAGAIQKSTYFKSSKHGKNYILPKRNDLKLIEAFLVLKTLSLHCC